MAAHSSEENVPPMLTNHAGGVLTFSFLGPQSYVASSYPHPILDSKETNSHETREIALSKNLPSSLFECIESLIDKELASLNASTTRYFTLTPGCYFMHITCWQPGPLDGQVNEHTEFDEDENGLWLVYSWSRGPQDKWHNDPADAIETIHGLHRTHPTLGYYVKDIRDDAITGGNLSHVALGETSDTFFIRVSDNVRNWHYRFSGLPPDCELAIQKSMVASKLLGAQECSKGLQHWTYGRLRAVTLGQYDGWILHREAHPGTLFGGCLPHHLGKALEDGRKNKLIINQAVLNPHHWMEYVLAFNDGSVYYSFHYSFKEDFDRIAMQWCTRKGVVFKPSFIPLDDAYYPPPGPPQTFVQQLRSGQPVKSGGPLGPVTYDNSNNNNNTHRRPYNYGQYFNSNRQHGRFSSDPTFNSIPPPPPSLSHPYAPVQGMMGYYSYNYHPYPPYPELGGNCPTPAHMLYGSEQNPPPPPPGRQTPPGPSTTDDRDHRNGEKKSIFGRQKKKKSA